MPIRESEKAKYPPREEWASIRERILKRAGNCCEWKGCGVKNYSERPATKKARLGGVGPLVTYDVMVVLTIAHLDHDPANCADDNLAALCQRCHLRHDRKQHAWNAARTRARKAGQAEMDFLQPPKMGGIR